MLKVEKKNRGKSDRVGFDKSGKLSAHCDASITAKTESSSSEFEWFPKYEQRSPKCATLQLSQSKPDQPSSHMHAPFPSSVSLHPPKEQLGHCKQLLP
mmetsp:Transcript_202/g.241  ORF Transcript_202/g.241 Transcript_202/m.241 type:complete len:98 (+) Transcript_202:225-518(+)